jgi:hypothetical protein
MYFELNRAGLSYQSEHAVSVKYREIEIPGQRVDLIVENVIVVELKAVARFDDVHRAQLIPICGRWACGVPVDQLSCADAAQWAQKNCVVTIEDRRSHEGPKERRARRAVVVQVLS